VPAKTCPYKGAAKAGFVLFVDANSFAGLGRDLCSTILRLNDVQGFFQTKFPGVSPRGQFPTRPGSGSNGFPPW
jgi:hypothetical protein